MAKLLEQMKMPIGKQQKKKLDSWLNDNVNLPLAEKGYGDAGAALSAALSAAGEMIIPDDLADAALAMVPGARLMKAGAKGMKILKKTDKAIQAGKKTNVIDYGEIRKVEKAKADAARAHSEKTADTLVYDQGKKTITRKRADLFNDVSNELKKNK